MMTFALAPAHPHHRQSRIAAVGEPRHPLGDLSVVSASAPVLQQSHDGCACGGACPECQEDDSHRIQTALNLGASGDIYEREADRVAEYVTRMTEPERTNEPQVTPLNLSAQPNRRCTAHSSEEERRGGETATDSRDALDDDHAGSHTRSGVLERVEAMSDGGQPLEQSVRGFFEPRFGRQLSHVRVDTSAAAAEAARELNAKAFTVGSYIAFASSQYAPGSARGDRLLAHELTHTIQQAPGKSIQRRRLSGANDDETIGERGRESSAGLVMRQAAGDAAADGLVSQRPVGHIVQRDDGKQDLEKTAEDVSDRKSEIAWSQTSPGATEVETPGEHFLLENFAIDDDKLKQEHEAFLRDVVFFGTLSSDPMATLVIIGHADSTGPTAFNEGLAKKRARAVEAALKKLGEHSIRIGSVSGRGARSPIASNGTVIGRAENRRVEILVKPFRPTKPLPTLLADLSKGVKPFVVNVENFAACPFPDTVKQIVEDAFKSIPIIHIDWEGKSTDTAESFITFDDTSRFKKALALSGDIFLDSFRNNEICKTPGDPSTCEKAFPDTAAVMGHAIGNTVAHEIGHSLALDHVPATDNFMWSPDLHPLALKTNKTFDEKVLLQRTLQAVSESFNASQLVHMVNRIKEKRKVTKGTVEFE